MDDSTDKIESDPSPAEIRRACLEIQKKWSRVQEKNHAVIKNHSCAIQIVQTREINFNE